jgi:hypothetical protein
MRCRGATVNSVVTKFRSEVLAHFHSAVVKCHSSMRYWLFGLPLKFSANDTLDVKENYENALNFLFTHLIFSVLVSSNVPNGRIAALSQGHNGEYGSRHW